MGALVFLLFNDNRTESESENMMNFLCEMNESFLSNITSRNLYSLTTGRRSRLRAKQDILTVR